MNRVNYARDTTTCTNLTDSYTILKTPEKSYNNSFVVTNDYKCDPHEPRGVPRPPCPHARVHICAVNPLQCVILPEDVLGWARRCKFCKTNPILWQIRKTTYQSHPKTLPFSSPTSNSRRRSTRRWFGLVGGERGSMWPVIRAVSEFPPAYGMSRIHPSPRRRFSFPLLC